jgi:hypothetical protein
LIASSNSWSFSISSRDCDRDEIFFCSLVNSKSDWRFQFFYKIVIIEESLSSCFFHVSEKNRLLLSVFFDSDLSFLVFLTSRRKIVFFCLFSLIQKLSKKKSWIDRSISKERDQWQQYHKLAATFRCWIVMKISFKNQKNHRKLKKYQSWIWSFQNWRNSRLVRRLKAHLSLDYTKEKKESLRIILQRTKIEK